MWWEMWGLILALGWRSLGLYLGMPRGFGGGREGAGGG